MEHSITLVIFTLLSQVAIGGFAAIFLLDAIKQQASKKAAYISLLSILVISATAVIVSVFHLGHPFAAYRAILNFDESWLSREIIFFPLFILFVAFYTFFAKTKKTKQIIGGCTGIISIITIFCEAKNYIIPAMPAWNNGLTMAAFFTTALLVGPVFVQLLLTFLKEKTLDISLYITFMAVMAILLNVINLTVLKGGYPEAVETAAILISSPLFWTKMLALVLGLIIAGYSIIKNKVYSLISILALFSCFFVAEFIGRMLFYSSGIHL